MTWLLAFLLALAAWLAMAFLFKAPRKGWEAIGAALLVGIAGYGLQASPDIPGAPKPAAQRIAADPQALIEARAGLSDSGIPTTNRWVVIADALARNGQYANAAQVLRGAVDDDPKNGEAWLAMANALVAHAEGRLTPAALYAFQRAEQSDPDNAGPPFFLGLAMAQSGRFDEARALWSGLLERSPEGAPWRSDLESRLGQLDAFIEARQRAQAGN